jgi:NMD protein affecting ribosome stability and mRNA decay
MKAEQPILSSAAVSLIQTNGIDFSSAKKYPADVLREKELDNLPGDVNPSIKEVCR